MVVLVKAAGYAATLGASGAAFFLVYCGDLLSRDVARAIRRMTAALLILSLAAQCGRIAAAGASMTGDVAGLVDVGLARLFLQSGELRPALQRLLGLLLMASWLGLRRPAAWLGLLGAAAAATSLVWSGHVHALAEHLPVAQRWLPVAVLAAHLLGGAFWLGALAPLLMVARQSTVAEVAATAARFGAAARYVVAALLVAGASLAFALLRDPAELWGDAYGRVLLAKVMLVMVLLCLAAVNRWRLTPRLIACDAEALRLFRLSVRIEMVVGCGILCVTSVLTSVTGPAGFDAS